MDQLKGAVVGLRALKAVMSLKGNATHVAGGLCVFSNGSGPVIQILLNGLQVGGQVLGAVLKLVELSQNADGNVGFLIQGGVASGNNDNGDACFWLSSSGSWLA